MLTFLFYSGRGLFDRLIQWFTRSRFNHVAVQVGNDIYEADGHAWVKITGDAATAHAAAAAASVNTHPDPTGLARAIAWAERQLGDGYGYDSDLMLAFGLAFSRRKVFVCSTGAAEMAVRAGVLDDDNELAETPGSLALALGVA